MVTAKAPANNSAHSAVIACSIVPLLIPWPAGGAGLLLFDGGLLPLIKAVGDDEAPLLPLPRIPKRRLRREVLRSGVERRIGQLPVLRPVRQQPPPHHAGNALPVLRADRDQHRRRRRLIPIGLEVRRWRGGVEQEPDLDLRVVVEKSDAPHILQ